jgi:hypothetical protein
MTDRHRQDDNEDDEPQTHPIDPPVSDDQHYRLEKGVVKSKGDGGRPEKPNDRSNEDPALPADDATLKTKI